MNGIYFSNIFDLAKIVFCPKIASSKQNTVKHAYNKEPGTGDFTSL